MRLACLVYHHDIKKTALLPPSAVHTQWISVSSLLLFPLLPYAMKMTCVPSAPLKATLVPFFADDSISLLTRRTCAFLTPARETGMVCNVFKSGNLGLHFSRNFPIFLQNLTRRGLELKPPLRLRYVLVH